jgi:hypothetical protein
MSKIAVEITEKQIVELIKDCINKNCYLNYNKENGTYTGDIYTDYNDYLEDSTIKDIFKSKNPKNKFYELLDECYVDCGFEYQYDVIKTIADNLDEEIYDGYEDFIKDWVYMHVNFNYPYEHYINQSVQVDIIVDTGDESYDYTLNCVYPHYNGRYGEIINNQASLVWLTKQQGYTKLQLNKALRDCDYGDSKFLKSVRDEVANCTSHMNSLAFFVDITLGELLDLQDKIIEDSENDIKEGYRTINKRKGKGYLTIDKNTSCGLYDNWNGAGSILEISLDKDVKLPIKYISSATIDGNRGYGVDEIYGMCSSFWKNGGIKEIK